MYSKCLTGCERKGEKGVDETRIEGRLRERLDFWRAMGASRCIINILESGFRLPLESMPGKRIFNNHGSCSEHKEFVTRAVADLVKQGCAVEMAQEDIVVCSPLGVHDNGRKLRLILDMRYVNNHLARLKFKMDDIKTAMQIYKKNDYLITFDLKSGYHHVSIHKEHWPLLAFKWKGVTYAFTVLPFGCSASPWCFTKVTRVLVKYWRGLGIRCMMYMDDGSAGDQPANRATAMSRKVREDLERAGFLVNEEKSNFTPKQRVQQLGFELDTCSNMLTALERRVQATKAAIRRTLELGSTKARELAKVAGHILSLSAVLGQVCRLWTRAIYEAIDKRLSWSSNMTLQRGVIQELAFWKDNLDELHGRPLWSSSPRGLLMCTDASDSGWGGHSCQQVASGEWTKEEASRSSTWRELRAVRNTIEALKALLQGESCIVRLDNQAAVSILKNGSRHPTLQQEAMEVYGFCRTNGIALTAQWVPREENTLADMYSRIRDENDWMLSRRWFRCLDERFGPHTVDCFASCKNNQIPRFFSRWWCPGCEAADAFTTSWAEENVWMVPPVHLILRAIKMVQYFKCHGTLVVPFWRSAVWWPEVCPGGEWAPWVIEALEIPQEAGVFKSGSCEWNIFSDKAPTCKVLALRLCLKSRCEEGTRRKLAAMPEERERQ